MLVCYKHARTRFCIRAVVPIRRHRDSQSAVELRKRGLVYVSDEIAMAQFVGKPLPDFSVKPLKGGELGAKTSLKGLAAGRPLVRLRRVLSKRAALFVRRASASSVLRHRTRKHTGRAFLQRRLRRLPPLCAADGGLAARARGGLYFCVCLRGR